MIELEADLDKHAVKKWETEEFSEAVEQGRIGDEYFRRQQYLQAAESFQVTIDKLQILQQRIRPTFEHAVTRGEQALSQGDQSAAVQQFELAVLVQTRSDN